MVPTRGHSPRGVLGSVFCVAAFVVALTVIANYTTREDDHNSSGGAASVTATSPQRASATVNRDAFLFTALPGWDDEGDDPPEGADHIDEVRLTPLMSSPTAMRLTMALWKPGRGARRLWLLPAEHRSDDALLEACARLCHAASLDTQCVTAGVVRQTVDGPWYCVGRRTAGLLVRVGAKFTALVLGVVRVAPAALRTAEARVVGRSGLLWTPVGAELQWRGVDAWQHVMRWGTEAEADGAGTVAMRYELQRSPFEAGRVLVTLGGERWRAAVTSAAATGLWLRVRVLSWSRVVREARVRLVVDDDAARAVPLDGAVRAEFDVGAVLGALHTPEWEAKPSEGVVRLTAEATLLVDGDAEATTSATAVLGPSADGLMAWVEGGVVHARLARCRDGACVAAVPSRGSAHDMAFVGAWIRPHRPDAGAMQTIATTSANTTSPTPDPFPFVPSGGQRWGGLDREGRASLPGACVPRAWSAGGTEGGIVLPVLVDVRVGFRFEEEPWEAIVRGIQLPNCVRRRSPAPARHCDLNGQKCLRVVASVTAHECPACVVEHASNIIAGIGADHHAATVFHLSRGFQLTPTQNASLARLHNTWVNPRSARTAVGFLLIDAHRSNLLWLLTAHRDLTWDYVVFIASNERFVRHGIVKAMAGTAAALMTYASDSQPTTHAYGQLCTSPEWFQRASSRSVSWSRKRHVARVRPLSAVPTHFGAPNMFRGTCPSVGWADADDGDPGKGFWPTLNVPPLDDVLLRRLLLAQASRRRRDGVVATGAATPSLYLTTGAIAFEGTYMSRRVVTDFLADWAAADAATTEDERRCIVTYPTSELYVAAWLRAECETARCGPRVSTVFWCRDPTMDAEAASGGEWVPTADDLRRIVCEGGEDEVYLVKRVPRVPLSTMAGLANATLLQRWLWRLGEGSENVTELCGA